MLVLGAGPALVAGAAEPPGTDADAAASGPIAATDVEAAVDAFIAGWEAEDTASVAAMFTADAVAYDPVPPGKFAGAEGIDALLSGTFGSLDDIEIELSERSVHSVGPVAWFQARYLFSAQPASAEGEPVRDEGHVTMIWVRQDDGSLASPLFHASPLPPEPAAANE